LPGSPTRSHRQAARTNFVALYSDTELEAYIDRCLRLGMRRHLARRLLELRASPIQLGAGENAWIFSALTYYLEVTGVLDFGGSVKGAKVLAACDRLHLYIPASQVSRALEQVRSVELHLSADFGASVAEFFDELGPDYAKYLQIDLQPYRETLHALTTYMQLAAIQCTGLMVLLSGPPLDEGSPDWGHG